MRKKHSVTLNIYNRERSTLKIITSLGEEKMRTGW